MVMSAVLLSEATFHSVPRPVKGGRSGSRKQEKPNQDGLTTSTPRKTTESFQSLQVGTDKRRDWRLPGPTWTVSN